MKAVSLLFLLGATALVTSTTSGCNRKVDEPTKSDFAPTQAPPEPPGPEKLEVTDVVVGTGREARDGDKVKVRYVGTLMSGKEFDRSQDTPFEFTIGQGQVIKGWDQGVVGMRVGGKRKLAIPSELGYGEEGSPPNIPPNAGLKFDVELVEVE
jgi:FKBP-type peptidyl-prolyl cis-trans isomerase FkpA